MSTFKRLRLMPEAMYERLRQNETTPHSIKIGEAASLHNPFTFKLSDHRMQMLTDTSVPIDVRVKLFYQYLMRTLLRARAGEDPPAATEFWKQADSSLRQLFTPAASSTTQDNNYDSGSDSNDSQRDYRLAPQSPYHPRYHSSRNSLVNVGNVVSPRLATTQGSASASAIPLRPKQETLSDDNGKGSGRDTHRQTYSSRGGTESVSPAFKFSTPNRGSNQPPTTTISPGGNGNRGLGTVSSSSPSPPHSPSPPPPSSAHSSSLSKLEKELLKIERIALRLEVRGHIQKYLEPSGVGSQSGLKWRNGKQILKRASLEKILSYLIPYKNNHPATVPVSLQVIVDILKSEGFDLSRIPNEHFHKHFYQSAEYQQISSLKQYGGGGRGEGLGRRKEQQQQKRSWKLFK